MAFLERLANFSTLTQPSTRLGKILAGIHPYLILKKKNDYNDILRKLQPVFNSLDRLFQIGQRNSDNKEIRELSLEYRSLGQQLQSTKATLEQKKNYLLEFKKLVYKTNRLNQFHDLLQSENVRVFNANRQLYPTIQTLFHGLNLKRKNLQNIDFRNTNIAQSSLSEIDLTDSDCIGIKFSDLALYKLNFTNAQLDSASFTEVKGSNIDFTNSHLPEAKFENCKLLKANFHEADLSEVIIKNSSFQEADFSDAELISTKFRDVDLTGVDFSGTKLFKVDFFGSNLMGANFKNAELMSTEFGSVDLTGADFKGAKLSNADFDSSNLMGADFSNCNLRNVKITSRQLEQIINPLSANNVNFREGIKWLFKNIDSKELSNLRVHQVIRFLDIDFSLINSIDPSLQSKINTIDPRELIARLYLISETDIFSKHVCAENHQARNQLCRVLYNSCGNNLEDLIHEGKLVNSDLRSNNASDFKDSLNLVFDTFVLPRLEKFLDTTATKELKQWQLSKFREKLIPYLVIAISQNRFFDPSSDYSKLKGKVASLPKNANYKMPSLLLNISKGIHNPVVAYATAVRHISPEGSWHPILNSVANQVEITLPNSNRRYLVKNLINYKDFDYESSALGHCIGQGVRYVNKAKGGKYHYFSIREAETGKPVSTVEFALGHDGSPRGPFEDRDIRARNSTSIDNHSDYFLQQIQHRGKRNSIPTADAKEILKIFLQGVKDGTYPISLKPIGKDSSTEKLSAFENTIGTSFDDTEVINNRKMFDTTNVHSIQARAWIKLAQPKDSHLENRLQDGEIQELNPGIGVIDEETGETIQLGGYRAKPEGIPYDNYFIPNSCRGDLSLESINPRKVNDKRLRFSQFSGNDLAEIDKGIERFFNTKVTDQMSFDDLIKSTIETVQKEELPKRDLAHGDLLMMELAAIIGDNQ